MKKIAMALCGVLGLLVASQTTQAQGPLTYSGQQPWWNIFAKRQKLNPEEEKLQHFWHDYYDSMGRYYQTLEHIDWVTYYKNHGYQINSGGGPGCTSCGPCGGPNRIQFAPVFVTPGMQWAVPNSNVNGPPNGPQNPPSSVYTQGGPPMSYGPPPGPPYSFGGGGFGPPGGPPGGPMGGPMGPGGPGGPMGGPMMGPGGPMMGPGGPMMGPGGPMMGPGGPMMGPGGPMMGPGGPMMGPGGPMMGPGGPQAYNYNQFNGNFGAPVTQAAYNYGYNYGAPVTQAAYSNYGVAPAYANGYDANQAACYNYGNYGAASAFASGYDANTPAACNNFGVVPAGYVGNGFVGNGFNGYHGDGCRSDGCPANQVCFGDPYPTR